MIKLVHHEMVINSKFLEVPRSYYQRNLNANRVKRIAAEFDERIANAPKVSFLCLIKAWKMCHRLYLVVIFYSRAYVDSRIVRTSACSVCYADKIRIKWLKL